MMVHPKATLVAATAMIETLRFHLPALYTLFCHEFRPSRKLEVCLILTVLDTVKQQKQVSDYYCLEYPVPRFQQKKLPCYSSCCNECQRQFPSVISEPGGWSPNTSVHIVCISYDSKTENLVLLCKKVGSEKWLLGRTATKTTCNELFSVSLSNQRARLTTNKRINDNVEKHVQ